MDRLASMQTFVQVVDSGSFADAAKRLAASPSAVTHHVQALEDRLGVQLLNRTTRKLALTEVGRTFYEQSARILAEVDEAERSATLLQTTPSGLLRLNTSEGIARVLMPLIAEFSEAYPEMTFDVVVTDRMVNMVEEGFDLALRAGPLPDSTLISRKLALGKLTLCAAPDYLARHSAPQRPEDLIDHNCLIYNLLGNEWRFTGRAGDVAVAVSGNLRSNSLEAVRRAALSGQGIGLLAAVVVAEDLQKGALVRLLPEYDANEMVIQAVYPPSRHLSVKTRSFLDFLAQRMNDRAEAIAAGAGIVAIAA